MTWILMLLSVESVFIRSETLLFTLTQLQRGQREQRKDQRDDPEARDDLRFRPASQLKMVVQWRHLEDPLLAQLVGAHLNDHRQRLHHKNAADERQQQLLLDNDGHRADGATERQRADVAHKNLRRVG